MGKLCHPQGDKSLRLPIGFKWIRTTQNIQPRLLNGNHLKHFKTFIDSVAVRPAVFERTRPAQQNEVGSEDVELVLEVTDGEVLCTVNWRHRTVLKGEQTCAYVSKLLAI